MERVVNVRQLTYSMGCMKRASAWKRKQRAGLDVTSIFVSVLMKEWLWNNSFPRYGFATSHIQWLTKPKHNARTALGEKMLDMYIHMRGTLTRIICCDSPWEISLENGVVTGRWDSIVSTLDKRVLITYNTLHVDNETFYTSSIECGLAIAAAISTEFIFQEVWVVGRGNILKKTTDIGIAKSSLAAAEGILSALFSGHKLTSVLCCSCEFNHECNGGK